MRRVRYQVAMSLDGYIAGPQGEADWILMDPEIDFAALFRRRVIDHRMSTAKVELAPEAHV